MRLKPQEFVLSSLNIMKSRQIKWTQDLRKVLYARLVMEFGEHSKWELTNYPKGKKARYNEVLEELAKYFQALTGKPFESTALDQQVAWAVTRQQDVANSGFAYQYILNKAAALEMGFISSSDLPLYMVTESKSRIQTSIKPD